MFVTFREAGRADVPAVLDLLRDDHLGSGREQSDIALYHDAFDQMISEPGNRVIVGEADGRVVATYQITFIRGLSLRAARRAQLESVRVASDLRGQGIGGRLIADAEKRARAAGCKLMQLTMNATRADARRFYEAAGFTPTHIGFKRDLS